MNIADRIHFFFLPRKMKRAIKKAWAERPAFDANASREHLRKLIEEFSAPPTPYVRMDFVNGVYERNGEAVDPPTFGRTIVAGMGLRVEGSRTNLAK